MKILNLTISTGAPIAVRADDIIAAIALTEPVMKVTQKTETTGFGYWKKNHFYNEEEIEGYANAGTALLLAGNHRIHVIEGYLSIVKEMQPQTVNVKKSKGAKNG